VAARAGGVLVFKAVNIAAVVVAAATPGMVFSLAAGMFAWPITTRNGALSLGLCDLYLTGLRPRPPSHVHRG
jgi:hypothetical protein